MRAAGDNVTSHPFGVRRHSWGVGLQDGIGGYAIAGHPQAAGIPSSAAAPGNSQPRGDLFLDTFGFYEHPVSRHFGFGASGGLALDVPTPADVVSLSGTANLRAALYLHRSIALVADIGGGASFAYAPEFHDARFTRFATRASVAARLTGGFRNIVDGALEIFVTTRVPVASRSNVYDGWDLGSSAGETTIYFGVRGLLGRFFE